MITISFQFYLSFSVLYIEEKNARERRNEEGWRKGGWKNVYGSTHKMKSKTKNWETVLSWFQIEVIGFILSPSFLRPPSHHLPASFSIPISHVYFPYISSRKNDMVIKWTIRKTKLNYKLERPRHINYPAHGETVSSHTSEEL